MLKLNIASSMLRIVSSAFSRHFSFCNHHTNSVAKEEEERGADFLDTTHTTRFQSADANTPILETSHTGRNVLRVALKTLSSVSSNIPFGSVLSSVIDPLLDIADRIEQTSVNAQGLIQLAARIELLAPLVSEMANERPQQGRVIVEALQRELQSITKDLDDAYSHGKLNQFFNGTDNASSLSKHNQNLARTIADATYQPVVSFHMGKTMSDEKQTSYEEFKPTPTTTQIYEDLSWQ
ncbi:hypothetical protein DFH07DRAFT_779897 [Mycena maculata]|uniref:Uncharacterized protein n=1 Tax=Mycena maculata TaxID=230809 RepID=A0AAD7MX28_9AGAR|nr:hypothetical protein DFH07DRAFT_779897 [Mycena maculata]